MTDRVFISLIKLSSPHIGNGRRITTINKCTEGFEGPGERERGESGAQKGEGNENTYVKYYVDFRSIFARKVLHAPV